MYLIEWTPRQHFLLHLAALAGCVGTAVAIALACLLS